MNEEKIEAIKNAIRQIMQMIIERGKPLSNELKIQITKVLEFAVQRIAQLRSEGAAAPTQTPPVASAPYPSSNIFGFNYEPDSQTLLVKFMGKDVADSGPVYSYAGVPKFLFDVLRRGAVGPKTSGQNKWHRWRKGVTPSHGAAMYALIKEGGFTYQKIS